MLYSAVWNAQQSGLALHLLFHDWAAQHWAHAEIFSERQLIEVPENRSLSLQKPDGNDISYSL